MLQDCERWEAFVLWKVEVAFPLRVSSMRETFSIAQQKNKTQK